MAEAVAADELDFACQSLLVSPKVNPAIASMELLQCGSFICTPPAAFFQRLERERARLGGEPIDGNWTLGKGMSRTTPPHKAL